MGPLGREEQTLKILQHSAFVIRVLLSLCLSIKYQVPIKFFLQIYKIWQLPDVFSSNANYKNQQLVHKFHRGIRVTTLATPNSPY